jgi:hypothetical protein
MTGKLRQLGKKIWIKAFRRNKQRTVSDFEDIFAGGSLQTKTSLAGQWKGLPAPKPVVAGWEKRPPA